jgi:hypothetical protein
MKKQILYPEFTTRVFGATFDLLIILLLTYTADIYMRKYITLWVFSDIITAHNLDSNNPESIRQLLSSNETPGPELMKALVLDKVIPLIVELILLFAYVLAFLLRFSRTPAKFITQTIIVDSQTFEKPTKWQFIKRTIALVSYPLGIWLALFTKQKQALHDLIAGTVVIVK